MECDFNPFLISLFINDPDSEVVVVPSYLWQVIMFFCVREVLLFI